MRLFQSTSRFSKLKTLLEKEIIPQRRESTNENNSRARCFKKASW